MIHKRKDDFVNFNKRKFNLISSVALAAVIFLTNGFNVFASQEANAAGVYVKQMGRGYCTLASAVDMMRSKMYLAGNASWPNVTQQSAKSTAWLNGAGLYHQFTYYGMTVTYKTGNGCNTKEGLINLLNQCPEGIEIYIRDLPHAVLLTRYEPDTGIFYVADPVYADERPIMESWDRKAGSTQDAVIKTIDAYWYISKYENQIVPGGLVGEVYTPPVEEDVNDEKNLFNLLLIDSGIITDDYVKSTIQLPYTKDYNETNFLDIEGGAWYIPSIKAAYEMAMMIGVSDTEFHVKGNITLAQTICVTARIHNIYHENNYDFTSIGDEPWFMPYVRYTKEKGILDKKYDYSDISLYDQEALRIEFVEILSKALPEEQITKIKKVELISDIPAESNDERFNIIYDLYNAGILIGDGEGFKPLKKITRAEVATVISRMGDASLRVE